MIEFLRRLFGRGAAAIAEARPRDAEAIAALHAASFHRGWSEEEVATLLVERSVMAHRASVGGRLAGDGVRTVFLEVDETNTPAIRLYRRAGFGEVGRRPNYYATPGAKPAAALVLRRDLG
jgi:ribosomal-protein-alanine N-acetyltransferase